MKLNQSQIQDALLCGQAFVFDEINSTNAYLLEHYQTLEQGTVCLAGTQNAGFRLKVRTSTFRFYGITSKKSWRIYPR